VVDSVFVIVTSRTSANAFRRSRWLGLQPPAAVDSEEPDAVALDEGRCGGCGATTVVLPLDVEDDITLSCSVTFVCGGSHVGVNTSFCYQQVCLFSKFKVSVLHYHQLQESTNSFSTKLLLLRKRQLVVTSRICCRPILVNFTVTTLTLIYSVLCNSLKIN
jgi:hypothetical protein